MRWRAHASEHVDAAHSAACLYCAVVGHVPTVEPRHSQYLTCCLHVRKGKSSGLEPIAKKKTRPSFPNAGEIRLAYCVAPLALSIAVGIILAQMDRCADGPECAPEAFRHSRRMQNCSTTGPSKRYAVGYETRRRRQQTPITIRTAASRSEPWTNSLPRSRRQ